MTNRTTKAKDRTKELNNNIKKTMEEDGVRQAKQKQKEDKGGIKGKVMSAVVKGMIK